LVCSFEDPWALNVILKSGSHLLSQALMAPGLSVKISDLSLLFVGE